MKIRFGSRLLPIGEIAPDFTASTGDGTTARLSEWRGKKRVVLVFYPGDNTPVCTAQLCAFRDDWSQFQAEDTLVYGVNPSRAGKHTQFTERHNFPFPLLVDTRGRIAAAYGCRMLFGLIRRTVYVVDRQGRIAFAQRGNPATDDILRALRALQDSETPSVREAETASS